MVCYNKFMNDEYYRDEPIYKIRPSNVKAKLKPMFKIEKLLFSISFEQQAGSCKQGRLL